MESVTTYVPPEIKRNLEKWAKEEDRSISYLVARLITETINEKYPQKSSSPEKGKEAV
ncbi:MAG: CopG family transcriptional regulator [Cyanobacteria bacterium J06629_18]